MGFIVTILKKRHKYCETMALFEPQVWGQVAVEYDLPHFCRDTVLPAAHCICNCVMFRILGNFQRVYKCRSSVSAYGSKVGCYSPLEMCLNDCATSPHLSYRTYLIDSLSWTSYSYKSNACPICQSFPFIVALFFQTFPAKLFMAISTFIDFQTL